MVRTESQPHSQVWGLRQILYTVIINLPAARHFNHISTQTWRHEACEQFTSVLRTLQHSLTYMNFDNYLTDLYIFHNMQGLTFAYCKYTSSGIHCMQIYQYTCRMHVKITKKQQLEISYNCKVFIQIICTNYHLHFVQI